MMKLLRLKIQGFRSFDDEQTIELANTTLLIGNNGTGKTAALEALSKLFASNAGKRALRREDFHISKGQDPETIDEASLSIEAVFEMDAGASAAATLFDGLTVYEPQGPLMLRIRLESKWERSLDPDGTVETLYYFVTCPEDQEIDEGDKVKADRRKIDCIRLLYIPATRNPEHETRNVSGSAMNGMLGAIRWEGAHKDKIVGQISGLNDEILEEPGVKAVNDSIGEAWKSYDSDARYGNANLKFGSMDLDDIMKNSSVLLSPTVSERDFEIDEIGDGLRSLFHFSLIHSQLNLESAIRESLSNNEDTPFDASLPAFTVLAVEEPENHIAPHLLGRLTDSLGDIARQPSCQVVLTSHSPSIVRRIDPSEIRYFRIEEKHLKTVCSSIVLPDKRDEKYKFVKGAIQAYPELFFARLVVLGEGESEELILRRVLETGGGSIDAAGVSVVPLGGRHVNHFWRLLDNLRIPHITLLDLDKGRYGGGLGRVRYAIEQIVENGVDIASFSTKDGRSLDGEALKGLVSSEPDDETLEHWIGLLEGHNVFFSAPLDIDFLMLERYTDAYKGILSEGEGPQITGLGKIAKVEADQPTSPEYLRRVEADVENVLGESDGHAYSEEERRMMVWYKYFFLSARGKPATHIMALSSMDDVVFEDRLPEVLKRLRAHASTLLETHDIEDTDAAYD